MAETMKLSDIQEALAKNTVDDGSLLNPAREMKFSDIQEALGKSIAEETVRKDKHARGQFKLIYRVDNRKNLEFENFSDAMLAAGNDITRIRSKRIYINRD